MKHTCSDELRNKASLPTPDEQKAWIRVGFRCQICNARSDLKLHYRDDESPSDASHALVLCGSCYELAQACKRKRMQGRMTRILQLVCLAFLYLGLTFIFMVLANLLPFKLLLLCLVAISIVMLLKLLTKRWL